MPVAPAKRDSLEAMGPVVGEELLEAAAEAAKENSASQEESRNAAEDWSTNSGTGGGVGESDFEPYFMMTELNYCQELGLIFTNWSDD